MTDVSPLTEAAEWYEWQAWMVREMERAFADLATMPGEWRVHVREAHAVPNQPIAWHFWIQQLDPPQNLAWADMDVVIDRRGTLWFRVQPFRHCRERWYLTPRCAVAFLIRLARRFHDDRDFVDR